MAKKTLSDLTTNSQILGCELGIRVWLPSPYVWHHCTYLLSPSAIPSNDSRQVFHWKYRNPGIVQKIG